MQRKDLQIGDLVETCQMLPGFITEFDDNGTDGVSVFIPGVHKHWSGGHHSIENCGVHKIDSKHAMMLYAIGEERLRDLWSEAGQSGVDWKVAVEWEFEEIKAKQKISRLLSLEEIIEDSIKSSGYYNGEKDKIYVVNALKKVIENYGTV